MYEKSELLIRKKDEHLCSRKGLFIQSDIKAGIIDISPSEPAGMVAYPYWQLDICPAIPAHKVV